MYVSCAVHVNGLYLIPQVEYRDANLQLMSTKQESTCIYSDDDDGESIVMCMHRIVMCMHGIVIYSDDDDGESTPAVH